MHHLSIFYVAESNPHCLLIATVDGNTISNEKFYTAAKCLLEDLKNITIEDILKIRIIEIIFLLKDIISNENNFGWLCPSKKLLIIDFSIDKNESIKTKPTTPSLMLKERMDERGRYQLAYRKNLFHTKNMTEKKNIACRAIQSFTDSFTQAIDSSSESINEFILTNSFSFDGGVERATLKLKQVVERSRSRWDELITTLGIKK